MYPNSALSAWQLAVIAVVAVAGLAIWLAAVYLAAREPRTHAQASAATPAEIGAAPAAGPAAAGSGDSGPAVAGDRKPDRHAA